MPHALVRARNHSDSMRWRRHVEFAKRGEPSTTWIARPDRAKQSQHAVPPTACWDCSVRCGSEPWSVERSPRDVVRPHRARVNLLCRFCRGWKCNHPATPRKTSHTVTHTQVLFNTVTEPTISALLSPLPRTHAQLDHTCGVRCSCRRPAGAPHTPTNDSS